MYSAGFGYERDFIALEYKLQSFSFTNVALPFSCMRKTLKFGCEDTARCSFCAVPTASSVVATRIRASLSRGKWFCSI